MVAKREATKAKKAGQNKGLEGEAKKNASNEITLSGDEPAEPIIKPDPANGAGIKEGPGVLPGSKLVEVQEDIFEEKALPGTQETTKVLVARKGQMLSETALNDLRERGVI